MEIIRDKNPLTNLLGPLSFYKKALAIALPVMGQLLIQNMVSLIDNFMVAGLGDIKMSGVNIAGQINFVFLVLINTICLSGGIFMSQYNGAKNPAGMQQVFRFKLFFATIASLIYTTISIFFPRPFLALMVHGNIASEPIIEEGVRYMRILAFSWIPTVIATSIGSSLREIGKVKPPLIISVTATAVNTFFNWIFIYGNLGAPRLETVGAAIATIIARVVEVTIFIIYICKTKPPFYFKIIDFFKVKISLFFSILKKSALVLVSEMSWVLSETVTTALYNSRGGAEVVSGMAAGFAIANLFFVCFSGIATVTGVIMGGTLGANRLDEARIQKKWLLSGALVFGVFAGLLGLLTTFIIPIIYGNLSSEAQIVTRGLVLVNALYMPVWAFVNAQFAISRTGGDATMGAIVDLSTNTLLVIPGMFALTYLTKIGPVALYGIIKLVDFVKITICAIWLKKERWLTNLAAAYYTDETFEKMS
ncbi:MAG: MATE family efflux transporter [Spirochaetaceae bacterium]|nr:MATE family efflux transporter [Spirochaetaceae bacterium]